jgi:hypothetical protein
VRADMDSKWFENRYRTRRRAESMVGHQNKSLTINWSEDRVAGKQKTAWEYVYLI